MSWIGDNYCDDENSPYGIVLTCPEFNNDGGDCNQGPQPGQSCGDGRIYDCSGSCVDQATAMGWIGDNFCDDENSSYGIVLTCPEFGNDGGDCDPVTVNPAVAHSPMTGSAGTTFVQWGTGFTPNSTGSFHVRKPDGTEFDPFGIGVDGDGNFETSYTVPPGKPAGTYTWWVVDGPTGIKSNDAHYDVTAPQTGQECGDGKIVDCAGSCVSASTVSAWIGDGYCDDVNSPYGIVLTCPEFNNDGNDCSQIAINPTVAQSPASGITGTVFLQWGTGFTPNSTGSFHVRKPDGTEFDPFDIAIDGNGHFETSYEVPPNKPPGTYAWWVADGPSGVKSNEAGYVINPVEPGQNCGSGLVIDCAGNCVSESNATAWIGDGVCDDGYYGVVLTCPEFNNDGGDCNPVDPVNPTVAQSPASGGPGTTFVQWGTGFTPNSTGSFHVRKPDGTEYDPFDIDMDGEGHFETSYTAPPDKEPGTYTWWVIDGPSGIKSNEVSYDVTPPQPGQSCGAGNVFDCAGNCVSATTAQGWTGDGYCDDEDSPYGIVLTCSAFDNDGGDCDAPSVDPAVAHTPMSGPPGTTFVQWGTGFTPNSTGVFHVRKPDGTEYDPFDIGMDGNGHFETTYTAPFDKVPGTYTWWVIDGPTGIKSNEAGYSITSPQPGTSCGSGNVFDCAGNCVNESDATNWIDDGYCDDGSYGIVLTCSAFNNDGGDCDALQVDPAVAQSPTSGPHGTAFVQWGTGFTPNSTGYFHVRKPDGTQFDPFDIGMDGSGNFETTYTAPSNKPPGVYTWWVIDGPTGIKSNEVSYTINVCPTIAQGPMGGYPGTTFVQWGTGFTPNSTGYFYVRKPDGTQFDPFAIGINSDGHFETSYTAPLDKPSGGYTWWVIDGPTGIKSNEVTYQIY